MGELNCFKSNSFKNYYVPNLHMPASPCIWIIITCLNLGVNIFFYYNPGLDPTPFLIDTLHCIHQSPCCDDSKNYGVNY